MSTLVVFPANYWPAVGFLLPPAMRGHSACMLTRPLVAGSQESITSAVPADTTQQHTLGFAGLLPLQATLGS